MSYVPPPVGDPYEVEYPQYLTIPTSWPSSLTDQQPEPALPLAVMLNAASKWVHSFLHKSYFSSNPLEQKFSTCIYAFFASELLSLILAANITQFEDWFISFWPWFYIVVLGIAFLFTFHILFGLLFSFSIWTFTYLHFFTIFFQYFLFIQSRSHFGFLPHFSPFSVLL